MCQVGPVLGPLGSLEADRRDRPRVLFGYREGRRGRPGALQEEPAGRGFEDVVLGRRSGGRGSVRGGTGYSCSPRTRSGARLVQSTVSSGYVSTKLATSEAAFSGCPKSSTRSRRFPRRYERKASSGVGPSASPDPATAVSWERRAPGPRAGRAPRTRPRQGRGPQPLARLPLRGGSCPRPRFR